MTHRAIVIGCSMGGLLAGIALRDAFDEVLLIDKSTLPEEPVARASVPQARHAHGLLAGGLLALEELLPGLLAELKALGCPTGDNLRDAAWIIAGRRLAMGDSGVRGMTVDRPLLETVVRARVQALPRIRITRELRATGLVTDAGAVRGLRTTDARGQELTLEAALVVDASGRSSKLPEWLKAEGLPAPRIDEVALDTRYASRVYARDPSDLDGVIALLTVSDPSCPRGGIALAIDEQRWLVSQYAMGGSERVPTDHDGYVQFARRLPSPELSRILERSEPLSDAATLRFPSSIRRRYETLKSHPRGLIACADALCSFNPTFGQGITVAAKQAVLLRGLAPLASEPGFEAAFFAGAARIVDVAWNAAAGRSFLYPGVVGRPTTQMRIANAYLPHVVRRAHGDAEVAAALLKTMHFLEPPETLFAPRVLLRVLGLASESRDQRAQELWQDTGGDCPADSLRPYSSG